MFYRHQYRELCFCQNACIDHRDVDLKVWEYISKINNLQNKNLESNDIEKLEKAI